MSENKFIQKMMEIMYIVPPIGSGMIVIRETVNYIPIKELRAIFLLAGAFATIFGLLNLIDFLERTKKEAGKK